jgi:hypothetical protein
VARSQAISGRPINAARDVTQASEWLSDCEENHIDCNEGRETLDITSAAPTRLLDVGNPNVVRLSLTGGRAVDYLALTYRWPSRTTVTTTRGNLAQHVRGINLSSLNNTIRDAIYIARQLGFQYIWIDSLCIIQDDGDDWANEAANMASIYQGATLTLSASASTANDEGLLLPRRVTTDVKIPYNRKNVDTAAFYFVSDRFWESTSGSGNLPTSFDHDVQDGPLSRRGWCLQERALSRRILHFGAGQLHWECLAGHLSEQDASLRKMYPRDPAGRVRKQLLSGLPCGEMTPEETDPMANFDGAAEMVRLGLGNFLKALSGPQLFGKEPYATWYSLVQEYSKRELTNETDKMAALSGVARAFAGYAEDQYIAGLWTGDLTGGLLWHNASSQPLRRPVVLRPPTWSWTSLDGPVKWPKPLGDGEIGPADFSSIILNRHESTSDKFGALSIAFLRLTGRVVPMRDMRGFNQEYLDWLRSNQENLDFDCNPIPILDAEILGTNSMHCLLIAPVACHPNCRHAVGCDRDGMAYGLMLYRMEGENMYTRKGLSRPGTVYARVGLAKVFQSSFEKTPFGEITLI